MLRTAVLRSQRDATYLRRIISEIKDTGDRPRSVPPRRWDDTSSVDSSAHPQLKAARNTPGKRALNPRKQFLVRRVQEHIVEPPIVVVVHYNGLSSSNWRELRSHLAPLGYSVSVLPNMITKRALEQTPLANMAPLFWSTTCVVSGHDVTSLGAALKKLPSPSFEVIGGKIENRLLTPTQLTQAAELPGIDGLRAALVATISPAPILQKLTGMLLGPAGDLHKTLQSSQGELVSALQRYSTPEPEEDTSK